MDKEEIFKRIVSIESELAELKEGLNKQSRFTFSYEKGKTIRVAEACTYDHQMCDNSRYIENFRYRQNESNAQADFQLQKELMCIGALAEQIDPDYKSKIKWDTSVCNYFLYINNKMKRYELSYSNVMQELGVVYMPKDVAEKVCEIINTGGVDL